MTRASCCTETPNLRARAAKPCAHCSTSSSAMQRRGICGRVDPTLLCEFRDFAAVGRSDDAAGNDELDAFLDRHGERAHVLAGNVDQIARGRIGRGWDVD